MMGGLLVRVGEPKDHTLVPRPRQDLQSRREPSRRRSPWGRWRRHAGGRRDELAVVAPVLLPGLVQVGGRPGPGRIDDGVHVQRCPWRTRRRSESLAAAGCLRSRDRVDPTRAGGVSRGVCSGGADPAFDVVGVLLRSPAPRPRRGWARRGPARPGTRPCRSGSASRTCSAASMSSSRVGDDEGVDQLGAGGPHVGQGLVEEPEHRGVALGRIGQRTEHADPRALQPVRVQEGRVVGGDVPLGRRGVGVGGIVAGDDARGSGRRRPRCGSWAPPRRGRRRGE